MDTGSQVPGRGTTWYGATTTIDTSAYGTTVGMEGQRTVFPDTNPADRTARRSQADVRAILVRNVSGITLYKSMLVTYASGYINKRVDGYAEVTAVKIAGVVDDHLGSAGVRNGDLFWLIVGGPVLVYTTKGTGGFTGDAIAADDLIYAITAAASTANTTGGTTADEGGKMINWNAALTATSTQTTDGTLTKLLLNSFARAISAATSAETNTQKLIDLDV